MIGPMADPSAPTFVPSERFDRALAKAADYHRRQARKGSRTPYIGHLLTVAGYVLEDGGSEDEAIAALLTTPRGPVPRRSAGELREHFGPKVLAIVEAARWTGSRASNSRGGSESDATSTISIRLPTRSSASRSRTSWPTSDRCCATIAPRASASGSASTRSSPEDVLWYYESLARALRDDCALGAMADEFAHEVERLRVVVRGSAPGRSDV